MRLGCILSHKHRWANCIRGNLDYILMTYLPTLCIWIWVCDRLYDCSASIYSQPQLLLLHALMKKCTFLLNDVVLGHSTYFAQWDISRCDRSRDWQYSCPVGLALHVLLPREGNAKASQLIWRGWEKQRADLGPVCSLKSRLAELSLDQQNQNVWMRRKDYSFKALRLGVVYCTIFCGCG